MKKRTITSFEDYFRYTEKYKGQFYFRGQADTAWPICPSLFRSSSEITLDTERDVIRTYREKIPKITPLQALFLAQHYGSSTRICDLTISPLCALFFASEGVKDGVVYVIKKSQAIKENHPEMQLFVDILIGNSAEIREKYGDGITNLTDVLTRNYIVEYRDWGYSNPRAYRQGGTGIVFGFGYESNKLSPIGTASVDEMTEEKIVIPRNIKSIIMQHLSKFGYAKPILYSMPFEPLDIEVANLTQTECFVEKHADSSEIFYKISAKFRINTLFFDRDALAAQITDLHNAFFKNMGITLVYGHYFITMKLI